MAWSALLREQLAVDDLVVTAVASKSPADQNRALRQYLLALEHHSDSVPYMGKTTTLTEIQCYRHLSQHLPELMIPPLFTYLPPGRQHGWLLLPEVPNHRPPEQWCVDDVESILLQLARMHAAYWQDTDLLRPLALELFLSREPVSPDQLFEETTPLFMEGPGALLSEHAVHQAGQLAPRLLKAANGVAVLRALGGWPGILSETHLSIAADLLDDPAPMLEPLRRLPVTLLHGDPHPYHWHVTLFDEVHLLDWQQATLGPGVYDLVSFLEQFDVLYEGEGRSRMRVRGERPLAEETMIDDYLIALSLQLGSRLDSRAVRQAIPAARCLYVLINWFTQFAEWFDEMPNPYVWQKINRMPDAELANTPHEPILQIRPYLAQLFERFLLAYRSL